MDTMIVRAHFPLGTFLGHRDVNTVADFPDTARLHAAFVHSAGTGSTAVERDGRLRPSSESIAALQWLEEHPPVGVAHPRTARVSTTPAHTWRNEGTLEMRKRHPQDRKSLKPQSDAVAVSGIFEWGWEDVPPGVADVIAALCEDVSCLGESDSPVLLSVAGGKSWQPTHMLDQRQTGFPAPGGLRVRTPVTGRFDELEEQYQAANPTKPPSLAADRHSWTTQPRSPKPQDSCVRRFVYSTQEEDHPLPWPKALLLGVDASLDTRMSVAWAVALHRALAARLPAPAPSMLTGLYAPGAAAPANRVAIHVLPSTPLIPATDRQPTIAVLIPSEVTAEEVEALHTGLRGIRRIYRKSADTVQLHGDPRVVDLEQFWTAPDEGMARFWRPLPALVPEVRRQRSTGDRPWTLADAAALSVAHVYRDRFGPALSGSGGRIVAVRAVKEAGFSIHETHAIRDSRIERYAHKTPAGVVVQPYTGLIDLGPIAPPTALLALGQSRHLGGGLLFPEDLPIPVAQARGLLP